MISSLRSIVGIAVLVLAAVASDEGGTLEPEVHAAAVRQDEECAAGTAADAAGACSLSLRQLRAGAAQAAAVQHHSHDPTEAPADASSSSSAEQAPEAPMASGAVPGDLEGGVPGGWGEAADFANSFGVGWATNAPNASGGAGLNMTLGAAVRWGSCRSFGCLNYFAPWLSCQCNYACEKFKTCCGDYWNRCYHLHHHHHPAPAPAPAPGHTKILTLFHQTSPEAATLIVQNGFRPGTQGWCGGGIYFATSVQATQTKAIGPDSHKGAMLQAQVDVGRVKYMPKTCNRGLTGAEVAKEGYDSVSFNPGDGQEFIVYSPAKIISVKRI